MGYFVAPIFGTGVSGHYTNTSNLTFGAADSAFTGTAGATTGTGTNTWFATSLNSPVIIHQTRGTNAGQWERNYMIGYSPGTITFAIPLANTYTSGAQIYVMGQYTSLTSNAGVTLNIKPYDGTVGGIYAYCVSGRLTIGGTISGAGRGFSGGTGGIGQGNQGAGTSGLGGASTAANGTGGGGGTGDSGSQGAGGGGGGHSASGTAGSQTSGTTGGSAGGTSGVADLTSLTFGGGGGGGGRGNGVSGTAGTGGGGGALFIVYAREVVIESTGLITCNGDPGSSGTVDAAGGGGGAGGSVLIYTMKASIGTNRITVSGGPAGSGSGVGVNGGAGANGRIAIDTGIITDSGTTSPTFYNKGYQIYCGTVGLG